MHYLILLIICSLAVPAWGQEQGGVVTPVPGTQDPFSDTVTPQKQPNLVVPPSVLFHDPLEELRHRDERTGYYFPYPTPQEEAETNGATGGRLHTDKDERVLEFGLKTPPPLIEIPTIAQQGDQPKPAPDPLKEMTPEQLALMAKLIELKFEEKRLVDALINELIKKIGGVDEDGFNRAFEALITRDSAMWFILRKLTWVRWQIHEVENAIGREAQKNQPAEKKSPLIEPDFEGPINQSGEDTGGLTKEDLQKQRDLTVKRIYELNQFLEAMRLEEQREMAKLRRAAIVILDAVLKYITHHPGADRREAHNVLWEKDAFFRYMVLMWESAAIELKRIDLARYRSSVQMERLQKDLKLLNDLLEKMEQNGLEKMITPVQ